MNGLRIQWGKQPYVSQQEVILPVSFTSRNSYVVVNVNIYNGGAANEVSTIREQQTSSFRYGTVNERDINWIAIGY